MTKTTPTLTSAIALAALLAACARPVDGGSGPNLGDALAELDQAACSMMKVSSNGICQNGLAVSGIPTDGISTQSIRSKGFAAWFNENPPLRDVLMHYVIACAAPAGTAFTFDNKQGDGKVYTWTGDLGLAEAWASGSRITTTEIQAVTACLGAHVNKYGVHVTISVQGRAASGAQIPVTPDELSTFSEREACFFGDLFDTRGGVLYVGLDHIPWSSNMSSPRACGIDTQSKDTVSNECPPMIYVGRCDQNCTPDATGTFYESCTYAGKAYRPITTRIRPSDMYLCGDGVCQFTESYSTCSKDCPQ